MITSFITIFCLLAFQAPQGAVVLDRIAVVVGKRAIKTSDIDRDMRLTAFLNRGPLETTSAARRKAAERLIDQQIIRQEISLGEYPRASDTEADALLLQIRIDRFTSSVARMKAELSRYGLNEYELRQQLLWQLTVLRFIDERFRPGTQASDEDLKKYYEQHLAELKKQNPRDSSFEALEASLRETLEGEQTNKQFEAWLDESRKRARIDYHEEGLK